MRINNPQLFNGQYLASREQIFEKLGLGIQEGQTAQSFAISGVIDQQYLNVESIFNTNPFKDKFTAIDNSISAVSGAAISVAAGTGITISGEGTEKTIAVNANEFALSGIGGDNTYASKYALTFNGQQVGTTTINIPKDQFLEDAEFFPAATSDDVTASNGELTEGKPFIRFTFAVKVKNESGAETDEIKVVYVPVDGLVDTYTAGDGIAIDNNEVSIKLAAGNEEKFLTIGADGLILSGVQTAIDTAKSDAITGAVADAKTYTDQVSGDLTSAFDTKIDNLTSGAVATISGKVDTLSGDLGTLSTKVGENTQAISANADNIAANTAYINYVSGQVSGLPTAITTAKAEAISEANGYTNTVSGNLDTAAQKYASDAQTAAEAYADGLDFAQIALTGQLPADGEIAGLAKDTLWVTAEGDAKIGIANGDNTGTVIDISKEVADTIDGEGDENVVASTKAVVDYVSGAIADVNSSVNALNTIVDVEFTLGPSQLSTTIANGKVLAVYTEGGEQCYPTVSYSGGNSTISVEAFAPGATGEETFIATVMRYAPTTQA